MDFDHAVQAAYESILTQGDIAIDVGASVGRHTIPIARCVFPYGRVFAFEPLPESREGLAATLAEHHPALRRLITLAPDALSDYDGEAEFVVAVDAPAYSGLKERTYDVPTRLRRIRVTVKRLDSLFLDLPSLRLLKIDAEGGEYSILRGGAGCLRAFRPIVIFEFGEASLREYRVTSAEMIQLWVEQDYNVFDIRGHHLRDPHDFIRSATIQEVWDYVAVPIEDIYARNRIVAALRSRA